MNEYMARLTFDITAMYGTGYIFSKKFFTGKAIYISPPRTRTTADSLH